MFPVTLAEIATIVDGRLQASLETAVHATGASIDSRSLAPGHVFFALDGRNCRGADFLNSAMQAGASCAVLAEADFSRCQPSSPVIVVNDVMRAMVELASWNRHQSSAMVLAVTGSVGKTTTRQMMAAVLAQAGECLQSPGNYNNLLGVSLSLMQLTANQRFAVLELGASAPGEIGRLVQLAAPHVGIVTRVSPAHLTGFGSLENVQQAKAELPRSLSESCWLILNHDDVSVREMAAWTAARTVFAGTSDTSDPHAQQVVFQNGHLTFQVDGFPLSVTAPGAHCIFSALAAVAAGRLFGLPMSRISAGLKMFQPDAGRGRIHQLAGITLIDETYNASPASMRAVVETLAAWQTNGRRILVLGDMLELGSDAERYHFELGQSLETCPVDHVCWLGQYGSAVRDGWQNTRTPAAWQQAADVPLSDFGQDVNGLAELLCEQLRPEDVVVCKGSRGLALERVLSHLRDRLTDRPIDGAR